MKNRIISLIMAVCMVILAVPALALPALAAGEKEGFTTTFDLNNNWPTYESKKSFGQFNGNWEAGYFEAGAYRPYAGFSTEWDTISASDGSEWTYTGMFLGGAADIASAMVLSSGHGFYHNISAGGVEITEINRRAAVKAYRAPFSGTVELDLTLYSGQAIELEPEGQTKLDGTQLVLDQMTYFAMFVNGEMVWPTADGEYSNPEDWAELSTLDDYTALKGATVISTEVSRGDLVQFAVARHKCSTAYVMFTPVVTYQDGYTVIPEVLKDSFSAADSNWPTYSEIDGRRPLSQSDPDWRLGAYDLTANTFTTYTEQTCVNGEVYAHLIAGASEAAQTTTGAVYLASALPAFKGSFWLGESATVRPAFNVNTMASGEVHPMVNNLVLLDVNGDAARNATAQILIYADGELFATVTAASDATGAVTATFPAEEMLKGVNLSFTIGEVSTGVVAVSGAPTVEYTDIVSFMSEETTEEYELALEAPQLTIGHTFGLRLSVFGTSAVYEDAASVKMYLWDESVSGEKTAANAVLAEDMELGSNYGYTCVYDAFSIKQLADSVSIQIVVLDGEGEQVCESEMIETTMAEQVYAQYEAERDPAAKQMLVNLLNYAAYAQTYFGYKTDTLANADLEEEQKELDPEILYYAKFGVEALASGLICDSEIEAFSLILDKTISIRVYVDVWETEVGKNVFIQYGDSKDEVNSANRNPVDAKNSFIIEDIGINEMSKVFYMRTVVAYLAQNGRTMYYNGYYMSYSVESFAARMVDSTEPGLGNLVRAMMEFGKSVVANA